MKISLEVTEELRREAELRGQPVVDYVEWLIQKGRAELTQGPAVTSAIARIRALRQDESADSR